MRVLLIDVNCKYGSTGKIAYELYSYVNNQPGCEAAVCYGRGEKIREKNIYKFGLDMETYLHAGLARLTGFNGFFSFFSTLRLINYIKKFKPDVIHLHELHAYFVNISTLINFIKKKKIDTVWTFHCEYMYTGKCGHAFDCKAYLNNCGDCPQKKEYPKSCFFDQTSKMLNIKRKLLNNWDFKIVTPSKWLYERVKNSFLGNKEIYVINNGINTDDIFFKRTKVECLELIKKYDLYDKRIVLSIAPNIMSDLKGGKIVLSISNLCEDNNVFFVLIGAEKTERLSSNTLILKTIKNQNEIAQWYSLADVFLICSKRENFPTTCLEAFCCGTPVVGIDEGGTKETVPSPYGYFIKNDVTQDLCKTMLDAIMVALDSNKSTEYSHWCSEKGKEMYSNKSMCKKYFDIYISLLDNKE